MKTTQKVQWGGRSGGRGRSIKRPLFSGFSNAHWRAMWVDSSSARTTRSMATRRNDHRQFSSSISQAYCSRNLTNSIQVSKSKCTYDSRNVKLRQCFSRRNDTRRQRRKYKRCYSTQNIVSVFLMATIHETYPWMTLKQKATGCISSYT